LKRAWRGASEYFDGRRSHQARRLFSLDQKRVFMSVDTATVAKIASLARIKVTQDDLEAMVPELNGILDWVEQLGEVDVSGVEPMTAVIPNLLRLRADAVNADALTGGGIRDAVLANAPAAEHGFFGVPKVIE
jgi:aspartyl-tRNA(Asn)/glutamyl-tRNA(Gln) amidotransferase subunit C